MNSIYAKALIATGVIFFIVFGGMISRALERALFRNGKNGTAINGDKYLTRHESKLIQKFQKENYKRLEDKVDDVADKQTEMHEEQGKMHTAIKGLKGDLKDSMEKFADFFNDLNDDDVIWCGDSKHTVKSINLVIHNYIRSILNTQ